MAIERGGDSLATVRKALAGIRDRFSIDVGDGAELHAKAIATVSKRWFRVRDTYGVEVAPGDALSHREN
jgi:uncharacterized protein YxjI